MIAHMNSGPSPFADERVMSISPSEFAISIGLIGPHRDGANGSKIFDLASGPVEITFEPLPGVTPWRLARAAARENRTEIRGHCQSRRPHGLRAPVRYVVSEGRGVMLSLSSPLRGEGGAP